jgi:hypothetical protein
MASSTSGLELARFMGAAFGLMGKLDVAIAAAPGQWYLRSKPHLRGVPSFPPVELVPGQWRVMPLERAASLRFYCDARGRPQRHPKRFVTAEPGDAFVYVPRSPRFVDLIWFVHGDVFRSRNPSIPDSWELVLTS